MRKTTRSFGWSGLFLFLGSFSAAAGPLPDATMDGVEAAKKWSLAHIAEGEAEFNRSGMSRLPSPEFWGEQIIYSIQVDRFNNGDPANDSFNLPGFQQSGDLSRVLDFRHGGDLRGVTQRLDYLQDLGVTVLWLTPFLKHNGSYHGYCSTDPTQVDPGFGNIAELRELVSQAHRRGIRVVMDVVINHLCDSKTYYRVQPDHYRCSNELDWKNWNGQAGGSQAQGELAFSEDFFKPLKSSYFFNRCGTNSTSDMQGTGPAAVYGDFVAGMFDFDTRNHDFQNIFTNLFEYWIAVADIDGFRLDAAKHVSEDFVAYFSTEARHYARRLGKNNFFVVGEVAGPSDWIGRRLGTMYSNPWNPNDHGNVPRTLTQRMWDLKPTYLDHPSAKYPGLDGTYVFGQGGTAIDVLHNRRSPIELEGYFGGNYFSDLAAQGDYRLNWNLLEIHDWPRFSSHNRTSQAKSILGAAYLGFSEGAPILYYGYEQGFNGDCHYHSMNLDSRARGEVQRQCGGHTDALFRQDMFLGGMQLMGSTVESINRLSYIGPKRASAMGGDAIGLDKDPFLDRSHDLYQATRRFFRIRQSCKALRYGSTAFRWAEQQSSEGILAFSRVNRYGQSTYEALVVMNTAWGERSLPEMKVEDFSAGNRWKNLLHAADQGHTTGRGSLSFSGLKIPANSVMVFVPERNLGVFDSNLKTHLCVQ